MEPIDDDDAALVERARSGSRDAFCCLLSRHAPMAQRVCTRVLSVGLEDVMQETALQAWLGLPHLKNAHQFGAWLTGIALNVARRELRQRVAISYEALVGGRLVLEPLDIGPSPSEVAELREFSNAVRDAVTALPAGQRQAVLLVYLAGMSYREAAAVLDIEVGAVKTRLHKARGNLRESLHALWLEEMMVTETGMIEMRVVDVRRRTGDTAEANRSVVLLEEVGGDRQLPIWVGEWEGNSIAMLLEKVHVPRPLTHAFTASLLRASGVNVESVRIHQLVDETFYAQVVLKGHAAVDARPSDAVALALEMLAPIHVDAGVLETVLTARCEKGLEPPVADTMGAAAIVERLIANWPSKSGKPTR